MFRSERLIAYDAGPQAVLLVFARGGSTADSISERGTIPGHDGAGPLHMAFRITADSYDIWRAHLTAAGVTMRGEMARSEEHTSELQSLMRISYAVFCLK